MQTAVTQLISKDLRERNNCLDTSSGQSKLLVGGVTVNIVQEEEETETAESSSNTATQVADLVAIPLIHNFKR